MLALQGCLHRAALVAGGRATGWRRPARPCHGSVSSRCGRRTEVEGRRWSGLSLAPEAALKGTRSAERAGRAGACSGTARVRLCPVPPDLGWQLHGLVGSQTGCIESFGFSQKHRAVLRRGALLGFLAAPGAV